MPKEKLLQKAKKYIKKLKFCNIKGRIGMVNDYMIKIHILKDNIHYGKAVIYYSKKHRNYFVNFDEMRIDNLNKQLAKIFHQDKIKCSFVDFEAYTDGSCKRIDGVDYVGYGIVILKSGEVIEQIARTINNDFYKQSYQLGGEVKAVMETIKWCEERNIQEIVISHDLAMLEAWARDRNKAKVSISKAYKEFMRKSNVDVIWNKVKSHSGDKYNHMADKLAKKGSKLLINNKEE